METPSRPAGGRGGAVFPIKYVIRNKKPKNSRRPYWRRGTEPTLWPPGLIIIAATHCAAPLARPSGNEGGEALARSINRCAKVRIKISRRNDSQNQNAVLMFSGVGKDQALTFELSSGEIKKIVSSAVTIWNYTKPPKKKLGIQGNIWRKASEIWRETA